MVNPPISSPRSKRLLHNLSELVLVTDLSRVLGVEDLTMTLGSPGLGFWFGLIFSRLQKSSCSRRVPQKYGDSETGISGKGKQKAGQASG